MPDDATGAATFHSLPASPTSLPLPRIDHPPHSISDPSPLSRSVHGHLSVDGDNRPPEACRQTSNLGGFTAASFIIGMELCERLAYYAVQSNLLRYLQQVMQESSSAALKQMTNWTGVTLVLPVMGGFVADAYLGRYWTIALSSLAYLTGLAMLTLFLLAPPLKPDSCVSGGGRCAGPPTARQTTFFYLSLYLVSVGTGGIKPCLEAFGAEQVDEDEAAADGRRQRQRQRSAFFSWWYFALCFGGLLAVTVLVYIQNNWSWALGFGVIPTAAMSVGVAAFVAGTRRYRRSSPCGSPLTLIARVLLAALLNAGSPPLPASAGAARRHSDTSRCVVDKTVGGASVAENSVAASTSTDDVGAKTSDPTDESDYQRRGRLSAWAECTAAEVEEVKQVARVARIWLATIMYGVVYAQGATVFVAQVATMRTEMGGFRVPPASLQALTSLTAMGAAAAYEAAGGKVRPLRRIGAGMACGAAAMAAAALVDGRRRRRHAHEEPPLWALWTVPQFMLLGLADFLTLVAQQHFFFEQVPNNMRSLGMALYLSGNGLGYFISTLLQAIVNCASTRHGGEPWIQPHNVNKSHYDYFFWLLAILTSLNLLIFISIASTYGRMHVKTPLFGGRTQCVRPTL